MYKVNPVKATCMKYKDEPNSIQGMNDTCFGICAAFSNTNDVYNMDPECSKSCSDLIEDKKRQIYGVGSCDHQAPYKPVIWEQVPRFMPMLLNSGMGRDEALQTCLKKCQNSSLVNECMEDCKVDYDAVEITEPKKIQENIVSNNTMITNTNNTNNKHKSNKKFFYILITLVFVVLMFFIVKQFYV